MRKVGNHEYYCVHVRIYMYMYVQYNVHVHVALFTSIGFYKTKIKPEAMFYVELCSGEHVHVHNVYALKTGVYKCI